MSNDSAAAPLHGIVLLPCPFCGSSKTDWVFVEEMGEGYHLCSGCSARGPACFHCPEGLVEGYWNRRTSADSEDAEKWRAMQRSFSRPDQMRLDIASVWDSRNVGQ